MLPPLLLLAVIAQVAATPDPLATYTPHFLITGLLAVVGILWRDHQKHDAARDADLAFWRDLALKGTELADKATTAMVRKR